MFISERRTVLNLIFVILQIYKSVKLLKEYPILYYGEDYTKSGGLKLTPICNKLVSNDT